MKNTQPYLSTSEMPGSGHPTPPWTQVFHGPFWEWMQRWLCRRAKARVPFNKPPDISDQWGCPYWLKIDKDEYGEKWILTGGLRTTQVGKVFIGYDGHTFILHDITIFDARHYRGRGLGSILLQRVISYAKEQGMNQIVGELMPEYEENRPQLVRWYESFGFKVEIRQKPNKEFIHCIELDL